MWLHLQEAEHQIELIPDGAMRMAELRSFMADLLFNFHQRLHDMSLRERSQAFRSAGLATRREQLRWLAVQRRTTTPCCLTIAIEFLRVYCAYPVSTPSVREA